MAKGKLIVIEGLDGSGKATQTGLLCRSLAEEWGHSFRRVSFPDYQDPSSALVKLYLAGELGGLSEVNAYGASLFYTVDRYASYLRHWGEDYRRGWLIVSDRYATSNVAHQMSKLPRGEWDGYLRWLEETEYLRVGLPRPDRVVYLDMAPETSERLLSRRYQGDESKKDLHEADLAYLLKCREAALYGAERLGWVVLPCCSGGDPYPPEEIAKKVWQAVQPVLKGDS
ncbi:MAG: thymidylate kinase [Angelakisella sp.]|jgi:dTMP kinase|nr:thymidylate kinase [Angelakisella sp.]